MSVRPGSAVARGMLRPMRPNPLMATRTVILVSPQSRSRKGSMSRKKPAAGRDHPGQTTAFQPRSGLADFGRLIAARGSSFIEFCQCRLGNLVGRDAEMLVQILVGSAGA